MFGKPLKSKSYYSIYYVGSKVNITVYLSSSFYLSGGLLY